jgi:hypothetical protein
LGKVATEATFAIGRRGTFREGEHGGIEKRKPSLIFNSLTLTLSRRERKQAADCVSSIGKNRKCASPETLSSKEIPVTGARRYEDKIHRSPMKGAVAGQQSLADNYPYQPKSRKLRSGSEPED